MLTEVQFKRLRPEATIPRRAYNSAGYDLWPADSGVIWPNETVKISLGFAAAFDPHYAGVIDDRGSTGSKSLTHLGGVFDADWRGEWVLWMHNAGKYTFSYSPHKAIAQVLFLRVEQPEFVETDTLPESARGEGMMGSSGH